MALAIASRTYYAPPSSATSHSFNVTLPVGTFRKVVVTFNAEFSGTITALTFDGTTFLANVAVNRSGADSMFATQYYYDVPDVKADGTYAVAFTLSSTNDKVQPVVDILTGAATGAPESTGSNEVATGTAAISASVTATTGAAVIASVAAAFTTPTIAWTGDVTERFETDTGIYGYRAGWADAEGVASGTRTATATYSTGTTGTKVLVVGSYAAAVVGPTITVQPANDVGIISNGQSTVYTATATGTNVDAPTWSVDGSPIADGGIYAIVTTGAGTSSCTSTLTITRTSKTGTPFDIVANFADDNGDTDTNTVTDTWWTGPQLTTFPATNGSGVSTATLTCDYVTGVGEAIEVRIPLSDGDVAVTVTTT